MKKYSLHKLHTLIWYDSPKMVVDFYSSMLFVWNDYGDQLQEIDQDFPSSLWVCFKLPQNILIDFLEGKLSLLDIFKNEKKIYGYLKSDYDTLVVGREGFRFDISLPGIHSFLLPSERVKVRSIVFGKEEHIFIKIVEFDGQHSIVDILLGGKPILDVHFDNYKKYIERLYFDQIHVLIYNGSTESFSWEEKNNYQLEEKRKTLSDYDFLLYKNGKTYELISKNDKVIITYEDIISSFPQLKTNESYEDIDKCIELSSGINELYYPRTINFIKEKSINFFDTPYLAVARFARLVLADDEIERIIKSLSSYYVDIQKFSYLKLEKLISRIPKDVFNVNVAPYQQGYILATYVRSSLKMISTVEDLQGMLSRYRIMIRDIDFTQSLIALSVWTNDCITILVNNLRKIPEELLNTTLAHEFAHILVDRKRSLPFLDLLFSKNRISDIEQRARAFAAEFLLPRGLAISESQKSCASISTIANIFRVSPILVSLQLLNGDPEMKYVPEHLWMEALKRKREYDKREQEEFLPELYYNSKS